MLSLRNILSVARYERKILFRSWFFRIFAILSLVLIGVFHGSTVSYFLDLRALSSSLLYSSMMMLNIVQSVIAMFLASDFMKRDKKLDTSEVLFIRPMSNEDYVIGKTWGIVSLFIYLNIAVMLEAFIITIAAGGISFMWQPYLYYFFLLSLPSLVFMLGLSFFLMGILKNQAITFVVLLAYIAADLFFLADKYWNTFDYLAFKHPMICSDIVGMSNMGGLVLHRMSFLLAGIGFIIASIIMLKRLRQSNYSPVINSIFMIAAFVGSVTCASLYIIPLEKSKSDRETMAELSDEYFDKAIVSVSKHNIELEHAADCLYMKSTMTIINKTDTTIDELIFTLNPGLVIDSVTIDGEDVSVERNLQMVLIKPNSPFEPKQRAKMTIKYSGNINPSVAYLDAADSKYLGETSSMLLRIDQQYTFHTDDYLLLTPEVLWYPTVGVHYNPKKPAMFRQNFSRYTLKVKTRPDLVAVSQGKSQSDVPGEYSFVARDPLPQISLAIGKYQISSVDLDGIEASIATIEGHDGYKKYLSETSDTVKTLLSDFLDDFERSLGMNYPYQNFTLLEVPVQFKSLQHSWTSSRENSQPQIVMLPERGFGIRSADFKQNYKWTKQRSERNNEGKTEAELQASLLQNFLSTLTGESEETMFFGQSPSNDDEEDEATPPNPYSIYPNYYYYVNFISSVKYPVLNYAFESYLRKTTEDPRAMFMSMAKGIGDEEKANILLAENSLQEIVADNENQNALNRVLKVKGSYLLSYIQKFVGDQDFDDFLLKYFYDNSFKEIKFEKFAEQMHEHFGIDLNQFVDDWYTRNRVPAYVVSDVSLTQTINDNQVVYLVKATISNSENVDGLVKFVFRGGGNNRGGMGGPFGGSEESDERIVMIGANQTKEIQMILTEQPRNITLNTLISRNIPVSIRFNRRNPVEDNDVKAVAYERVIEKRQSELSEDIYIVDNVDEGFSIYDASDDNVVKKFFKKEDTEEKYVGMGFGQTPSTWSLTANNDFYGDYIRSAVFVESGTGDKSATWQAKISKNGYYDVYVHLVKERNRGRGPGGGGGGDVAGSYLYTVYHDDGVDDIEVKLKDVSTGWNLLGSFYLSDSAKVVLPNKSEYGRVVADAVRWVKEGTRTDD